MSSPASSILSVSADYAIRTMTSADIPQIRQLHAKLLSEPYKPQFFLQILLSQTRICLVVHPVGSPSTIVGFISASIHAPTLDPPRTKSHLAESPSGRVHYDEQQVEILTLGVLPEHQRNGIGRRLIHTVVRKLRESARYSTVLAPSKATYFPDGTVVTAHVCTVNDPAHRLYEAMGLQIEGDFLHNYYRKSPSGQKDAYQVVGRVR